MVCLFSGGEEKTQNKYCNQPETHRKDRPIIVKQETARPLHDVFALATPQTESVLTITTSSSIMAVVFGHRIMLGGRPVKEKRPRSAFSCCYS